MSERSSSNPQLADIPGEAPENSTVLTSGISRTDLAQDASVEVNEQTTSTGQQEAVATSVGASPAQIAEGNVTK